jgi:hypothetical protein
LIPLRPEGVAFEGRRFVAALEIIPMTSAALLAKYRRAVLGLRRGKHTVSRGLPREDRREQQTAYADNC